MLPKDERFGSTRRSGTTFSGGRAIGKKWFLALLAYRELHADPSLPVREELELTRTVPARRWDAHRVLLRASELLLSGLDADSVSRERTLARELLSRHVSRELVLRHHGDFSLLTTDVLLGTCPFKLHPGINTFWSEPVDEVPASGPQVAMSLELGDIKCPPDPSAQGAAVIVAYCPPERLGASSAPLSAFDLKYVAHGVDLAPGRGTRLLSPSQRELLTGLRLTEARAAWSVGVQLFDAAIPELQLQTGLFQAAVGAARVLSKGFSQVAMLDPGDATRSFIMEVADVARMVTSLAIELLVCMVHEMGPHHHRVASSHVYDSKYFYAVSLESLARQVPCCRDGYELSLNVRPSSGKPQAVPGATQPGSLMRLA